MQQFLENPSNVILLIVVLLLVIATAICFNLYSKLINKNEIIENYKRECIAYNLTIENLREDNKIYKNKLNRVLKYPLENFRPVFKEGKEVNFVNMRYNENTKSITLEARRKHPISGKMEWFDVFLSYRGSNNEIKKETPVK